VSCVFVYCINYLCFESRTSDEPKIQGKCNGSAGPISLMLLAATAAMPIIVCSILTLDVLCRLFGTQVTPPAPILKALPKIFGHSDKTVRSEGSGLAHALYQYLGTGIEPWLSDLKPVQVKELKEAWDGMEKEGRGKGSLKPERMTRQQARDAEQSAAAGEGDAVNGSAATEEGALTVSIGSQVCE